ncbi:MAG: hypothetical protein LUC22_01320 [Prevotella sp.]|nr:hypothetical protein [Prevotella sp.]
MAVENVTKIDGERVQLQQGDIEPGTGTAGLETQVPGQATTVSAAASATGDIKPGNLIEPDVDEQLFKFQSDDTPLMQLALVAKTIKVNSPEVEHSMIDEPKAKVTTTADVSSGAAQATLPLSATDARIPQEFGTLLVKGVNGYDITGQTETQGKYLMLFVTGFDATTGYPIVRAVNGPKTNATDEYCTMPEIPAGTECIIMSNACHETQKNVAPDLITPKSEVVYLQKRIMNSVVSDYFADQKKHNPAFTQALIAEQAIANYKVRTNRSLWAGRKGKFQVRAPKTGGMEYIWFSEGILWQFKRAVKQTEAWDYDRFIALAKIYYTGEDVPKTGICLCGKNALESIQKIDWSKHQEVMVSQNTNALGWSITKIHTVFGDFEFKREPTLDRLGYSNSFAIIGENRLVRYVRSSEHSFNERIEGAEASRSGIINWDALVLKGNCHIWVDGGDDDTATIGTAGSTGAALFEFVTSEPDSPDENTVYYFLNPCTFSDGTTVNTGDMLVYSDETWKLYTGVAVQG